MKKQQPARLSKLLVFFMPVVLLFGIVAPHAFGQSKQLNKPVDTQKVSSLDERLADRKKEIKLELSGVYLENLETKCTAAQSKITQLRSKDAQTIDKYYQSYGSIADQITEMIRRLGSQAVSTAGIQTALNQYIDAANQYLVDADAYKTALADLETIECEKVPEDFAYTLRDARDQRAKLSADVASTNIKIENLEAALNSTKDKL